MNTVEERLKKIIVTTLDLDEGTEVNLDDKLEKIGLNSMSMIQCIVVLEEEFDIEFEDENLDITLFETGRNLLKYITNKLDEK